MKIEHATTRCNCDTPNSCDHCLLLRWPPAGDGWRVAKQLAEEGGRVVFWRRICLSQIGADNERKAAARDGDPPKRYKKARRWCAEPKLKGNMQ